jgi:gamma-glutamylcyclotransferase (GGCT)/AIG2-like uncharacterized protein YtfP
MSAKVENWDQECLINWDNGEKTRGRIVGCDLKNRYTVEYLDTDGHFTYEHVDPAQISFNVEKELKSDIKPGDAIRIHWNRMLGTYDDGIFTRHMHGDRAVVKYLLDDGLPTAGFVYQNVHLDTIELLEHAEPESDHALVFVYGTLKRGGRLSSHMQSAEFLGDAITSEKVWQMISVNDAFPAVTKGLAAIQGQVFKVDKATLSLLDMVEGVPSLYTRERVKIEGFDKPVWMYVAGKRLAEAHAGNFGALVQYDENLEAHVWAG